MLLQISFGYQTNSSDCLSVQEIIHKYIKTSGNGNNHAALASTSGELTWEKPVYSDFQILSRYKFNDFLRRKHMLLTHNCLNKLVFHCKLMEGSKLSFCSFVY